MENLSYSLYVNVLIFPKSVALTSLDPSITIARSVCVTPTKKGANGCMNNVLTDIDTVVN